MKLTCVLLVGLFALTCCATKQETVSKSKIGINLDYHKAVLRLAKFQCMRAYAVLEAFDMLPDNYTSMFTQELRVGGASNRSWILNLLNMRSCLVQE